MGEHALLSASGSHKWLHCPASACVEAEYGDTQTEYSREGTLAHAVGELKLQKSFAALAKRSYTLVMNKLKKDPLYSDEIDTCTDIYRDYVDEIDLSYQSAPQVYIEKKLDYSAYASEGFGTADCIVIGDTTLHVIDYKHGKGVAVDAKENPQMMLYGLGALEAYGWVYNIETVAVHVVQPRRDNLSRWEISTQDLMRWGKETVKPAAEKAFVGQQEFAPGAHCKAGFCKAKHSCRARAEHFAGLAMKTDTKAHEMEPTEIALCLGLIEGLKSWASNVQEYALEQMLAGVPVPGYKVVEGKSQRVFKNVDAAVQLLTQNEYDEALLYERNPLSLAKMEKVVGKNPFAEILHDQIFKPVGKPTLVPASDKREPYRQLSAVRDFAGITANKANTD